MLTLNMSPIIVDVIVVSVFILIMFFGFIRSIKNTSIDMGIFLVSFLLAFSSLTNSIKGVFATKIFKVKEWLPAGSSRILKFVASLGTTFMSTIAVFALFYILISVLKVLIGMIVQKRMGEKEKEQKSMLGRFCGLFLALLYQGGAFLILLTVMNTNIVGFRNQFDKTYVTKHIAGLIETIDDKVDGDILDTIVIKVIKGDVIENVDDNALVSYRMIEDKAQEMIAKKKYIGVLEDILLTDEEAVEMIKDRIIDLRAMAVLYTEIDEAGVAKEDFSKLAEEWLTTMNRVIKDRNLEKVEFTVEYSEIRLSLKNAGLSDDLLAYYDQIATGK